MILASLQSDSTYFSRRRRAAATQTRLPDWVWGAGLGALALTFVGIFLLVGGALGGGGGSQCDEELPPLRPTTVDAETFENVDESMARVVASLQAGDRDGARANFYGPTHDFTHAVDPPLREVDEEQAKELCEVVLDIETSMEQGSIVEALGDAQRLQETLRDAAAILGYPRPS